MYLMRNPKHIWFLLLLALPVDPFLERVLQEQITLRYELCEIPDVEPALAEEGNCKIQIENYPESVSF